VEINALWFALVRYLARLLAGSGDAGAAAEWNALADRAGAAFVARFWQEDDDFLADRWIDGAPDRCLRPNAVIAAALADSPLTTEMRVCVVRTAEAELLTPRGLRTLAPECPGYVGRYAGGPEDRDRAYHQGTVWPWLLGFYVEASLRAFGADPKRVAALRRLLDGLGDHLTIDGLDHVSEVFDGDAPHRPGGAIAQAWNTGEVLRAYRLLEEWST
jgi:glycogen debranching enzyme